ncbi:ribosomal protein S18 acetylase RimI-like enzyme [Neolewinella xylanilytica]|uniref:Ribosomal protein S18 acetylase RimI-like enzyme n=1 Tax=Neolewinella xylanilytica TaxID=1514080 RepID=A0A2S6I4H7_9BACT|nr:GNAT family N-acetyltransferase [Neolewinella xylanilytica]PPK85989.1 ribosomal protein S18 acetylase RimI-like enzyme [Neolewinella xylanilytica]
MNVQIRQGTAADLPAVHKLVGELAAYVHATPQFTATQENYRADFADGFFHIIVAEDMATRQVIGMCLYNFVYSTWKGRMIYLEDFVLQPAYRRQGIGQRLWDVLKERGRERGCKLLKWQIVDSNTEAMKFYAAQDAVIEDNWYNGKLTL